ncbi:AAA family ATPase [Cryptosporangium aurantiacum]|uniref:AAA domain-containing protein n=1 Tax=Cryptosporangium aurantiacum TaxID=134849 RepID=A0A1M7RBT2_9ACTN|nr:AAA family ATPase [Cryptosporangium aurantiacum]SHN43630.1 AAA domain-containing protein [Cryptosporangium aurantiacum]
MVHAVLITGPPGAGKSTLGRRVAAALGAALLDLDVLTGPLVGAADLDGGALRDARYDALVATAADCLAVGTSAVLVAPFTTERSDPDAYRVLVERFAGAVTTLVWLTAPADVLAARVAARGASRDAGKHPGFFGPELLRAPVVPHVPVDATATPANQLVTVLASLS